jgi:hypothetical protein
MLETRPAENQIQTFQDRTEGDLHLFQVVFVDRFAEALVDHAEVLVQVGEEGDAIGD